MQRWQSGFAAALLLFSLPLRADWLVIQPALLSGASTQDAIARASADELGHQLLAGAQACIEQINADGGIHGQPLRLQPIDSGGGPAATVQAIRAALQAGPAVALANLHQPVLLQALLDAELPARSRLPVLGLSSGAPGEAALASPWVFLSRPTYATEGRKLGQVLQRLGIARLGVYSHWREDLLKPVVVALADAGIATVVRNDADARRAAVQLSEQDGQAIVMLADTGQAARFVRSYRDLGGGLPLYGLSSIDDRQLARLAGKSAAHGVALAQVFPSADDLRLPLVRAYREALIGSLGSQAFSQATLEGYLNLRIIAEAIRRAGPRADGAAVRQALAEMQRLDLGGYPLGFGRDNRIGSSRVELGVLDGQGKLLR